MALRTASRLGVAASVRAVRLPFDVGIRLMGDPDSSLALTVDRADARARALVGVILGDGDLQDDAARRHAATDERVRALRLRERAEDVAERADDRLAEKEKTAVRRRSDAAAAAQRRMAEAEERRRARDAESALSANRRRHATESAKAAAQETARARADAGRLDVLEEKAEALEQKEEALIASDEAERLARAAETAKELRKTNNSHGSI
jgi:hypothetical protein